MNVWKLNAPRTLVKEECPVPEAEEGKIRVRVTKTMLSRVDGEIYKGEVKTKPQMIPGRFAIGQISTDTGNALFPKSSRVLFHTYRELPDHGTEERDFSEDDVRICGMTEDGFLRDFINVAPDEMTPLPDALSDVDALLVHYVAIAKTAIDRLGANKGDRVAVVGADFLGILISQLLIYQQASPILIDSNAERLSFAKRCGVYYALEANDDLIDGVASVTGGRLADKAIYVKTAGEDSLLAIQLVKRGGSVVVCASDRTGYVSDLTLAVHKQITLEFVSDPEGTLESSINLIVSKAVNMEPLKGPMTMIAKPEDFFEKEASEEDLALDTFRIHIFNLL